MKITINNKIYNVKVAKTPEEKSKGLQGITELPDDEGMLFDFSDNPQEISMWMKDTLIPLDIIFINEDQEVILVEQGEPNSTQYITCEETAYVLELNINSGVKEGDEIEFDEDEEAVMKVLASDGSIQMELWGGERIVSRKETKILIKKAKRADASQSEKDYKSLGKYLFKVFDKQDNRSPEYVNKPE